MSEFSQLKKEAMDVLMATSRTFFIPISLLPDELKDAVASAYLCMRAIDEIEDHPDLLTNDKIQLLQAISQLIQTPYQNEQFHEILSPFQKVLPEVSLRLGDWIQLSPKDAVPNILKATSNMADGMASWVEKDFQVHTEEDLDEYTYYVAGLVGSLLSELWEWYDGIKSDETLAIGFGRGLQAVNIIRNREEDVERGANFFPDGWGFEEMLEYAHKNLELAEQYTATIKPGPIENFCKIPLALAKGTLNAIEKGKEKLTREDVLTIVSQVASK
jgi:farnesyl-diphosphate farnesyltransferase